MTRAQKRNVKPMSYTLINSGNRNIIRIHKLDCAESKYHEKTLDFMYIKDGNNEDTLLVRYGEKTNWSPALLTLLSCGKIYVMQSYGGGNPKIQLYIEEVKNILKLLSYSIEYEKIIKNNLEGIVFEKTNRLQECQSI